MGTAKQRKLLFLFFNQFFEDESPHLSNDRLKINQPIIADAIKLAA
jgi:hypothetical protein